MVIELNNKNNFVGFTIPPETATKLFKCAWKKQPELGFFLPEEWVNAGDSYVAAVFKCSTSIQ